MFIGGNVIITTAEMQPTMRSSGVGILYRTSIRHPRLDLWVVAVPQPPAGTGPDLGMAPEAFCRNVVTGYDYFPELRLATFVAKRFVLRRLLDADEARLFNHSFAL